MLLSQKPVQSVAVVFIVIFTVAYCQDNERRRAVTEHQLMHDRGRSIQSLKRLMWLSTAMEGLHTAQARSSSLQSIPGISLVLSPRSASPQSGEPSHPGSVERLVRLFFNPHLMELSDGEP